MGFPQGTAEMAVWRPFCLVGGSGFLTVPETQISLAKKSEKQIHVLNEESEQERGESCDNMKGENGFCVPPRSI